MRKKIADAVKCPQKGCGAYLHAEEYAYFCDTCGQQMPDYGLNLRVWRANADVDIPDDYHMCSWMCLFRRLVKLRRVDFVSLPLVSATRGEKRFQELRQFIRPLLADT